MQPYETEFSRVYDIIVHEKPETLAGDDEMGFISWAFAEKSARPVKDILDVGCGLGRFLVPLAQGGYQLTGVDLSPAMLAGCQTRLADRGLSADLIQADMETLAYDRQFDALICMDSVICYLLDPSRVQTALAHFRQALRPGGLLILNIWNIFAQWELYGKAVPHTYADELMRVEWSERYEFESFRSILHMDFSGFWEENGTRTPFEHQEVLQAMTVGEVTAYLSAAGFTQVSVYADFDASKPPVRDPEELLFLTYRSV